MFIQLTYRSVGPRATAQWWLCVRRLRQIFAGLAIVSLGACSEGGQATAPSPSPGMPSVSPTTTETSTATRHATQTSTVTVVSVTATQTSTPAVASPTSTATPMVEPEPTVTPGDLCNPLCEPGEHCRASFGGFILDGHCTNGCGCFVEGPPTTTATRTPAPCIGATCTPGPTRTPSPILSVDGCPATCDGRRCGRVPFQCPGTDRFVFGHCTGSPAGSETCGCTPDCE